LEKVIISERHKFIDGEANRSPVAFRRGKRWGGQKRRRKRNGHWRLLKVQQFLSSTEKSWVTFASVHEVVNFHKGGKSDDKELGGRLVYHLGREGLEVQLRILAYLYVGFRFGSWKKKD